MTLASEVNDVPLHTALERIRESRTAADVLAAVDVAVRCIGFEKFAVIEWQGAHGVTGIHHNTPGAWPSSHEMLTMHPAVRRAMQSPIPFAWDQSFFSAANADDLWEHQAAHGLTSGLCTGYGPHDARACIVVTAKPGSVALTGQAMYDHFGPLLLIAGQCYSTLQQLTPAKPVAPAVRLSPRVLECLHWVLRQKTAWEIGVILGISERTVNQHLTKARQQLDVSNSNVAATKAVQLQLLPRPEAA